MRTVDRRVFSGGDVSSMQFQLNEDTKTGAAYTTLQTHNRPHYYMSAADDKFSCQNVIIIRQPDSFF